jgi:hypothetical protein
MPLPETVLRNTTANISSVEMPAGNRMAPVSSHLNNWLSMCMTACGDACLLAAVNPAMSACGEAWAAGHGQGLFAMYEGHEGMQCRPSCRHVPYDHLHLPFLNNTVPDIAAET